MCLAIPAELVEVTGSDPLLREGRVRVGSVERVVSLALLPEAAPGDFVLVHVGVAIARLDPAEAARVLEALEALGEAGEP